MIGGGLVSVLGGVVSSLEGDLRVRADGGVVGVADVVEREWSAAREAGRTEHSLSVWREGLFTQVAVGWVLASVFVRFCEDNGLIREPLLSGPGGRRRLAEDRQTLFYRENRAEEARGYLLDVFSAAAKLPGLSEVLGSHSPVWLFGPSDDACRDLIDLWRQQDPETGELVWDFTDPDWDTRFLGDLYQDLSESARKTFALLQTPDFIEEFILDRTLDPALDEFGLEGFRMIDPACGSGHFLLGAFQRLFERWQQRDPSVGERALAARALESVFGVDLNPFAVAIARFRLLVAALGVSGIGTLAEAPAFALNVAAGDSLLHGPAPGQQTIRQVDEQDPATRHLFATEDGDLVHRILGQKYHAVVANPPYITPKDPAANAAYRRRYRTCYRKYALTVPFMERLFDLAIRGTPHQPSGYVGQITANSFMKREFGKKLIEEFLATDVELTHVIDTSGVYIPGHGTPTVILFGRNRHHLNAPLRAALGVRGEPSVPADPRKGLVWRSIVALVDLPGSANELISVQDLKRSRMDSHPWSLQGGAALDLLHVMKSESRPLADEAALIGVFGMTNADQIFVRPKEHFDRLRIEQASVRPWVIGESIRDYSITPDAYVYYPYRNNTLIPQPAGRAETMRWPFRTTLWARATFSKQTYRSEGRTWWEWHQIAPERSKVPLVTFSFVATHNHFVLTSESFAFNRSAPLIKLATDDIHHYHGIVAVLNSSTTAFYLRQVSQRKNAGAGSDEAYEDRLEIDASKLADLPLPLMADIAAYSQILHSLGSSLFEHARTVFHGPANSDELRLERHRMVSLQEELDWRCYFLYGLTDEDLSLPPEEVPPINKGERAFEIALARRMAAGEVETSWFERHGSTPITELPEDWSDSYKELVERRLELIEGDRFINLVERPEYKRRWNWPDWDDLETDALRGWLLDRLESETLWNEGRLLSVAEIADRMRLDSDFLEVAQLYAKTPDYDLTRLIGDLIADEAVPYLAAWRYTDSGLRTRREWEHTWDLQRKEDAGEDVGDIPVPPKYKKSDFRSPTYWTLRGKLDVPKERFISYPGINRDTDPTLLVGWAGWDHLQQAKALAAWYEARRTTDAWDTQQLIPILAGIQELVPWIIQWHNQPDPTTGQRLGAFFSNFITTETQTHNTPTTTLTNWTPTDKANRGNRK